MPIAVHTISFRGTAGSIFILLAIATVAYIIGFMTPSWHHNGSYHAGLWEDCVCNKNREDSDWFHAVQAMMSIGLIALVIAFILISIYMCAHTVSKNSTIIALCIVCFLAVLFMVIGLAIYGSNMKERGGGLHWSYAVSVIAAILCLIAGILSIVQTRDSGASL